MKKFAEKLIEKIVNTPTKCLDTQYCNSIQSGIQYGCANRQNEIIDIINELAEEYKGGWIPCSERLPEKHQKVLVTYEDIYEKDTYYVCDGMYVYGFDKWNISDFIFKDSNDFKVLAWQPLPPAYKPKGE